MLVDLEVAGDAVDELVLTLFSNVLFEFFECFTGATRALERTANDHEIFALTYMGESTL